MKITLAALAAPLLLAACAAPLAAPTQTVTEQRTVTAPAPDPAPQAPASSSDGETIRELLASQGMTYSGPASDLDELATSVCDALDQGIAPSTLIGVARDSGFSAEEGAAIVAASIVVKCPWNDPR